LLVQGSIEVLTSTGLALPFEDNSVCVICRAG